MVSIATLRTTYRADKAALLQGIGQVHTTAAQVRKALQRLSDLADGVLTQLWEHAGLQSPMALLAVGGFGRGELFPPLGCGCAGANARPPKPGR
jgi:[protein-PII] uridylyltransferase